MVDKKPVQKMRFSDEEIAMVKGVFSENEDLLLAMRSVFVQLPLSKSQKEIITANFKGKTDLLKLMRKTFLPELDSSSPLNQMIDLWMSIDIKDKSPEEASIMFDARGELINLIEDGLNALADVEYEYKNKLSEWIPSFSVDIEERFTKLLARNTLISHVEMQLRQLLVLAGEKNETVEETIKRLEKNSSK